MATFRIFRGFSNFVRMSPILAECLGYYRNFGAVARIQCRRNAVEECNLFCLNTCLYCFTGGACVVVKAETIVGKKRLVNASGCWSVKKPKATPLVATAKWRSGKRRPVAERPSISRRRNRFTVNPERAAPENQQQAVARPEQTDWKHVALELLERHRQPEDALPLTTTIPLPRPFFSDDSWDNPTKFLEDFEAFYQKSRTRNSDKLMDVSLCLKRDVHEWFVANKASWETYDEFRENFLNKFWPPERRRDLYKEITSQSFDPRRGSRMVNFFLRRFNVMRSLMLPQSEEDIVSDLMRLFPEEVWAGWGTFPKSERTFQKAQDFLSHLESRKVRDRARPKRTQVSQVYDRYIECTSIPSDIDSDNDSDAEEEIDEVIADNNEYVLSATDDGDDNWNAEDLIPLSRFANSTNLTYIS
ncbi:hypothetical protein Zmor_018534 [Zophobas morio]|uniref:Retrotransposon gag domain-containing protein n=1 Tax=Zophobas morio TaxID=2755281 RepID=A0AA38MDK9_9CUCU|nr:hypothetical protein Zmor_018534 [Zophobas morio]